MQKQKETEESRDGQPKDIIDTLRTHTIDGDVLGKMDLIQSAYTQKNEC